MWGPFASPDPRVLGWSLDSLADLVSASKDESSGVRVVRGVEAARTPLTPPGWLRQALDFSLCTPAEIPPGYVAGWSYAAPIFDMPVYLDYLWKRAADAGATTEILDAPVRALRELARRSAVIVNCTGLGSRALVPDPGVSAAWGQLVVVENPGIEGFFSDYPENAEPTYFIAHDDHVVLGGRVVHERLDLAPDNQITSGILDRCHAAEPRLRGARVISVRTGLRPTRATVRLEREEHDGMLIIHNYGHGGSGVTLSWGCAREVLSLLTGLRDGGAGGRG
jgi:D-amino-acid oxidase